MFDFESVRSSIPALPGVYIFKDDQGRFLYVGKAQVLRNRVGAYFAGREERVQIPALLEKIAELDWIVTDNETEALVLESNLVKEHQPRYNIELRDDKHFPYVKITRNEVFPRVFIVRRISKDGATYFGPFTDATKMRRILRSLRKLFKIRTCRREIAQGDHQRPCLNYSIGICSGPCASYISQQEYLQQIEMIERFFAGRRSSILSILNSAMQTAAQELNFEKAAHLRDQIRDIRTLIVRQGVDLRKSDLHCDVFAFYRGSRYICLTVLMVREGVIINQNNHVYSLHELTFDNIAVALIDYYRRSAHALPGEILLSADFEDELDLIRRWFERSGETVSVRIPKIGDKKRLVERAEKAGRLHLSQQYISDFPAIHEELAHLCGLPAVPETIEAFDISNLGATFTVAGMVHFCLGKPDKSQYRRFKIKSVQGQDDFAMMMEAVTRRLRGCREAGERYPDLLLIDGGKGQLNAASRALEAFEDPPMIISLAKKEELIFSPLRDEPVRLKEGHPVRRLVQRIRDEVHRFAITYHRKIRGRNFNRSLLEDVPGIGPKKARKLLKHFGSAKELAHKSDTEISAVKGITAQNVRDIREELAQFF
ncbi:MAG: excinuclease ABC subunit UvrC [Fibrobacterota bacterium]